MKPEDHKAFKPRDTQHDCRCCVPPGMQCAGSLHVRHVHQAHLQEEEKDIAIPHAGKHYYYDSLDERPVTKSFGSNYPDSCHFNFCFRII